MRKKRARTLKPWSEYYSSEDNEDIPVHRQVTGVKRPASESEIEETESSENDSLPEVLRESCLSEEVLRECCLSEEELRESCLSEEELRESCLSEEELPEETYTTILETFAKKWLYAELQHNVSKTASNEFWKIALEFIPQVHEASKNSAKKINQSSFQRYVKKCTMNYCQISISI